MDLTRRASERALALATASASLPLLGRHLRPLGAMTALAMWGYRHLPTLGSSAAHTWLVPGATAVRASGLDATRSIYESAFQEAVLQARTPRREPITGRRTALLGVAALRRRWIHATDVPYGPEPEHRLDIWRGIQHSWDVASPVLIYLPGGGWVHGSRRGQGYALLAELASKGWVCLSASYRVAPHDMWPTHIEDTKRAIAWARLHVARYGGDPIRISVAGCSAGGHLAALAGLTANDPGLQPGFEDVDTTVSAVVTLYGRYDWESRTGPEREHFMTFLERVVVQRTQADHARICHEASPLARVHSGAPPFMVVHGAEDCVIPVAQA
jgi:acetyl esterase/lipase